MTITELNFWDGEVVIRWSYTPPQGGIWAHKNGSLILKNNTNMEQPEMVRIPSTTSDDEVLLVMRELGLLLLTEKKDSTLNIIEESKENNG